MSLVTLLVILSATSAHAGIEPTQSRPKRPLVLSDDALELHVGLATDVVTSDCPAQGCQSGQGSHTSVLDTLRLPFGVDGGFAGRWELGALVDLQVKPDVATTITGRARFDLGLGHILALGGALSLPLNGDPQPTFMLEIPALRAESAVAAVQAAFRYVRTVRDGPDASGLQLDAAGVFRIGSDAFAVLDFGMPGPDFDFGPPVQMGLGLGSLLADRFIAKLQVDTPDIGTLKVFEILVLFISTSASTAKSRDWL